MPPFIFEIGDALGSAKELKLALVFAAQQTGAKLVEVRKSEDGQVVATFDKNISQALIADLLPLFLEANL
jgi:hypothetical protein